MHCRTRPHPAQLTPCPARPLHRDAAQAGEGEGEGEGRAMRKGKGEAACKRPGPPTPAIFCKISGKLLFHTISQ